MNRGLLPSFALLAALCIRCALAGAPPDYVRFAEDADGARLELAIKTFTLPSGQKVDLIGVVHIADHAYYQALNQRFTAYDSVLFELVGDPEQLAAQEPVAEGSTRQPGGGAISFIQQAAADHLHLRFQLGEIDYSRKNMVHADVSAGEFAQMQRARGETTVTLFVRAMQAQLRNELNGTATSELDTFGLIRILMSRDSAAEFKKVLAKMLAQMESMTAAMESEEKTAILGGRNDLVVKKTKEVLADRRQRRIAVFYGAAHMPGIEASLTGDAKAKPAGEQWLTAWSIPKSKPAVSPPAQ